MLVVNSAWVVAGKVVAVFLGLALNALLARLLSPESLGTYFLFISIVSVSAVIAQLGMKQAIVRLVAQSRAMAQPARARQAVRTSFAWVVATTLVVSLLMMAGGGEWLAVSLFKSPILLQVAWLIAPFIVWVALHNQMVETLRGFNDIRMATIFGEVIIVTLSTMAFFVLWLSTGESDLVTALLISLVAGVSATVFGGVVLGGRLSRLGEGEGGISSAELFGIAIPLYLVGLASYVVAQFDIWIIGAYRPESDVALYGAAIKLAILIIAPLTMVNAALAPVIAEMFVQDKHQELEKILRVAATVATALALGALLIFALAGEAVLGLVFGEFYRQAWTVLLVLGIGQAVNVMTGSCVTLLSMTGHQKALMMLTILMGCITFVASVLAVQWYGVLGVAVAAASGLVLRNIGTLFLAYKLTGIWTHASLALAAASRSLPEMIRSGKRHD